ncbi:hypothetical protein E3N88_29502 [Mikania micrantha]|uniref:Uncharacterized protein n=1 Tax=Mikania micrantha TaxID=192012 RepID=A0A5N6MJX4_9ASTR|nr:hypothetical protein E3N88_29502 [Mikania micrantha]
MSSQRNRCCVGLIGLVYGLHGSGYEPGQQANGSYGLVRSCTWRNCQIEEGSIYEGKEETDLCDRRSVLREQRKECEDRLLLQQHRPLKETDTGEDW